MKNQNLKEIFNSPKMSSPSVLKEVLLTFGNEAYPSHGHAILLAGGAGSGKGFVIKELFGVEGVILDTDYLKNLVIKSNSLARRVQELTGIDIKNLDLRNPNDTEKLHLVIRDSLGIEAKWKAKLIAGLMAAPADRKPNVIVDTTMPSISRFKREVDLFSSIGYSRERIHLVWVVTPVGVAKRQNQMRDRIVSDDVLLKTHNNVAITLQEIIDSGKNLKNFIDGTVAIVFNRPGLDNEIVKSELGGRYVKNARIVVIKKAGQPFDENVLIDDLKREIAKMLPPVPGGW